MATGNQADYKQLAKVVVHSFDTFQESNGKEYPKERVSLEIFSFEGKTDDGKPYSGKKARLVVAKLTQKDGQVQIKQKVKNGYVSDDKQSCSIAFEDLEKLLDNVSYSDVEDKMSELDDETETKVEKKKVVKKETKNTGVPFGDLRDDRF